MDIPIKAVTFDPASLALVITAVFSGLGSLLVAVGTLYTTVKNNTKTKEKLADIKEVTDKVHILTNSSMTAAKQAEAAALRATATSLRANENLLRVIYEMRKTPSDKEAVELAKGIADAADKAALEAEALFKEQEVRQNRATESGKKP